MGAATTSLGEQARSIFDDLGYSVSRTGSELRAQRKWRVVTVTPFEADDSLPDSGELRCFVTWASESSDLRRRLTRMDVPYDWAVVGIHEDTDEYDVVRCPDDFSTETTISDNT